MKYLALLGLWTVLVACNYSQLKQAPPSTGGAAASELKGETLIDSQLIQTQILSSCQRCHSGGQVNLASLPALKSRINDVWREVSTGAMPPTAQGYSPFSACYLGLLQTWMNLGMPDQSTTKVSDVAACQGANTGGGTNPPVVEPPLSAMPLTYQTLLNRILARKCLICHNPNGNLEARHTLFEPYSEIQNSPRWKKPGATSRIIHTLTRTDEDVMPPPEEMNPMTPEEVDFIIRWIDADQPQ